MTTEVTKGTKIYYVYHYCISHQRKLTNTFHGIIRYSCPIDSEQRYTLAMRRFSKEFYIPIEELVISSFTFLHTVNV